MSVCLGPLPAGSVQQLAARSSNTERVDVKAGDPPLPWGNGHVVGLGQLQGDTGIYFELV